MGCDSAIECQAVDLLVPTANLYYTAIDRVIPIQPTRACFALCIVHVSTNITCDKINVDKAHVDKPYVCAYLLLSCALHAGLHDRSVCARWP